MTPPYVTSGNAKPWAFDTRAKDRSTLGGKFEDARTVWHVIVKPALALFACGIVATFVIAAIGA